MNEHEFEFKALPDGQPVATCACGWVKETSSEEFGKTLYTRHMRLNHVAPWDKEDEFGPDESAV